MPYQAPIQRTDPTVLMFLVDQSGSMGDRTAASEKTKAQFVADVLNRTLMDLARAAPRLTAFETTSKSASSATARRARRTGSRAPWAREF